ncbi:hypothetical protein M0L20_29825 [Spirosoma sp. RP8]|uniref:Uncharacterized protein n=1 Tax=Spirosoma liriopis TaxID=2937440 RepID=A0ABT0HWU8_9BACT|nr:hypothetical protein [Spirosoma liriopis]MCK8496103.1 hypothetical protein [Spirosoma liriopis]
MKSLRLLLALPVLTSSLFLAACKKEETQPQTALPANGLLVNGNIDQSAQGWFFGTDSTKPTNPNGYTSGASTEAYSSPQYSLKISCSQVKDTATFCFYGQQFIPFKTIPIGAKLTLTAKIKTALVGPGVSLAIRGDKGNTSAVVFVSSQDKTSITGTRDFTEYSVTLDSFPGGIDNLLVYLVYLPKTTGSVYFDDLSLMVN